MDVLLFERTDHSLYINHVVNFLFPTHFDDDDTSRRLTSHDEHSLFAFYHGVIGVATSKRVPLPFSDISVCWIVRFKRCPVMVV